MTLRVRLIIAFLGLSILPLSCLLYLSVLLPDKYDRRDREQIGELAQTLRLELDELGKKTQARLEEVCKPGGLAENLIKDYLLAGGHSGGTRRLARFAGQVIHLSDFDILDLLDEKGTTLFSRHDSERYGKIDVGDLEALKRYGSQAVVRFERMEPGDDILTIQSVVRGKWRNQELMIAAGYRIDEEFIERLDRLTSAAILLSPAHSKRWISSKRGRAETLALRLQEQNRHLLEQLSEEVGAPLELGEGAYNLSRVPLYSSPLADSGKELMAEFLIGRNRKAVEALILSTRILLASMVLGILLVSWGAAILLSRRITEPIDQLVLGARRVAAGDLDLHLPQFPGREVSVLVNSFNTMTKRLKQSQANLLRAERIAAWQEIARRLAHEIKNPLFPIQLSIQNLKKTWERQHPDFQEIFEESTETILQEVDRLKHIVNEFSQFARMPKLVLRKESISEIVQSAVSRYRGLPPTICLETDLPEALPPLWLDREKMLQVLLNLLNNAVDAMSGEGKLTLKGYCLRQGLDPNATVVLEISDTGPGIDPEIQKQLFRPYFTTKRGGTGLGLAIVHRIITEHQGRIRLESEPGRGATFILELPAAPMKNKTNMGELVTKV